MQNYEKEKTQNIAHSAPKAGMNHKTAGKYIHAGEGPEDRQRERCWRTREDLSAPTTLKQLINR